MGDIADGTSSAEVPDAAAPPTVTADVATTLGARAVADLTDRSDDAVVVDLDVVTTLGGIDAPAPDLPDALLGATEAEPAG